MRFADCMTIFREVFSDIVLTVNGLSLILKRCFMIRLWHYGPIRWLIGLSGKKSYRVMAENILKCLDESFEVQMVLYICP